MQKHRKLAAIMFTDIVGYTSLMSRDEENALRILQKNREVVKLLVAQFSGDFLKEMGDGTLTCFPSVVDAVNCALEIQNTLKDESDFKLRIGIHVGDVVVEEGGDVFGEGVNVASRIENLAEAGGICISERVYNDIRNKPVLQVTCLGEKELKNVEYPVTVYSLTRGGKEKLQHIEPVVDVEEEKERTSSKHSRWLFYVAFGVIVVVIFLLLKTKLEYKESTEQENPSPKAPSPLQEIPTKIAVLPFRDLSPEKDQAYLGTGIAEMIINALTNVEELDVISSTSSFQFKGRENAIATMRDSLKADWVLEGSAFKEVDKIRISAQLIRTADDTHIWSEQYDLGFKNIMAIQDSISLSVLNRMKFTLMGEEKVKVAKWYTQNPDAYLLYLKSLETSNSQEKLGYCEKALELDPDFALVYASMARTYHLLYSQGYLSGDEARSQAHLAINKAKQIDENLFEAYLVSAFWSCWFDWDWPAGEKAINRAMEINPGNSRVHRYYGWYLLVMGRLNEAIKELKQAQELNPLDIYNYIFITEAHLNFGNYEDAIKEYNKSVELDPENVVMKYHRARIYQKQGKYREAIDIFKEINSKRDMGYAYAISGEREKAELILNDLLELEKTEGKQSGNIAVIYTGLGENEKAFEWLDKAVKEHIESMVRIKVDCEFAPLRSDPRFQDILRKMGLPED